MKFHSVRSMDPNGLNALVNKYLELGWNIHSTGVGGTQSVSVAWVFLVKDDDREDGC